jgi:hypothetical protein
VSAARQIGAGKTSTAAPQNGQNDPHYYHAEGPSAPVTPVYSCYNYLTCLDCGSRIPSVFPIPICCKPNLNQSGEVSPGFTGHRSGTSRHYFSGHRASSNSRGDPN